MNFDFIYYYQNHIITNSYPPQETLNRLFWVMSGYNLSQNIQFTKFIKVGFNSLIAANAQFSDAFAKFLALEGKVRLRYTSTQF